jgi:hypothetical protein
VIKTGLVTTLREDTLDVTVRRLNKNVLTYCTVRGLPEKLTGSKLIRKFPTFYGRHMFITTHTIARHLYLS